MASAILGPAPGTAEPDPNYKLVSYLDQHYFRERDILITSGYQLRAAVQTFGDFIKHTPRMRNLTDATMNDFVAWLAAKPLQAETMRSKRRSLLTIWRAAYFTGLAKCGPGRIREIRAQRKLPVAWTSSQITKLLDVIRTLRGNCSAGSGVSRRWFWESLIRVGFDTGLRLGDLMRLRRSDIRPDGLIVLIQAKTGRPVQATVYSETMATIDKTFPPHRERIFGDALSRTHLTRNFPVLLRAAGLSGSIKYLRRSCASFAELTAPETAGRRLGHATPDLAQRHYVDPFISAARQELPPNPLKTPTEKHPAIALQVEWEAKATINPADIADLLRRLDVTQTAVSIALGKSPTWLNAILKGRERLAHDPEKELREFLRQRAESAAMEGGAE